MAKTISEIKYSRGEKIAKEMEEVLQKMQERRSKGERDPHLLMYTAIQENGYFDPKKYINQVLDSINYEGPERRRPSAETDRPLRKVC